MVADDAADVPGPKARNVTDGPTPSGIGLMAENYARLFHLTGDAAYRAKADALLAAFGGRAEMLAASPVLLAAADLLENAACVVVTGGDRRWPGPRSPRPTRRWWCCKFPAAGAAPRPSGGGRNNGPEPAAFVCQGGICALPVTTAEALRALLRPIAKN